MARMFWGMPKSSPSPFAAVSRVSMNPGATAFTLMWNGPSSRASVRVRPMTPPFAAV